MVYYSWINHLQSFVLVIFSFVICAQSDVPRPRGVSLSKASLYSPTKDFTCFDGTLTIPFSHVNDDYCDCFDGSDEPGTSACLNGVFHCTNAGHQSQNIPSSRVNDGICDCCDGTDEYASPESCPNTCEELGREARVRAQQLAELHKAGSYLRVDLIEKGNMKRHGMAEQLSQLEKDKSEAMKIKEEKEALKNELESKENEALQVYRDAEERERQLKAEQEKEALVNEAMEYFSKYDSNNDGILTIDEVKVQNVFDKNKDGEVSEEELQYFMGDNESVDKDSFVSSTWSMLKPLVMMEKGMFKSPKEVEEPEGDAEAEMGEEEELDETAHDDDAVDLESPSDDDHDVESEQTRTYDEETQKIVDEASEARRQFTEAERTVREIEANIRNIQVNLEKDYGLQQEFATLEGQCYDYDDKEYDYKLCMFQKVTQKSKNGGMEVLLGSWGEWAGEDGNKYSIMKYTNGIACWNGPNRIAAVNINCGLETKILSVNEPYRCEYKIELVTPAACDEAFTTQQQASHDEL
ncbi:glucosidase 2 subunit beta [Epargyreus clarus]|uniref:glucosidase 2 subunit beta n=1 Tax=Epargyreus clarus TaxID=520877 RepID=UPI003C2DAACE